jgi:ribosomal-protein-serine acetyltransferase
VPGVEVVSDDPGIVLRELTLDDLDAYFGLVDVSRAHLNRFGDHQFEHDATIEDLRAYFEHPWDHNVRFGIWCRGALAGRVDLNPIDPPRWVIGYWLGSGFTGRGIATVAGRAAIGHAETLGATEIYAGVTHGNDASVAVLRRLGFDHIQDLEDRSRWRLSLVPDPPPPVMA